MNETMLVVNAGTQGMSKTVYHPNGEVEERIFEPNVVVRCSLEMGEYLTKKYCDPTMAIFFRSAEGPALAGSVPGAPARLTLDGEPRKQITPDVPERTMLRRKAQKGKKAAK